MKKRVFGICAALWCASIFAGGGCTQIKEKIASFEDEKDKKKEQKAPKNDASTAENVGGPPAQNPDSVTPGLAPASPPPEIPAQQPAAAEPKIPQTKPVDSTHHRGHHKDKKSPVMQQPVVTPPTSVSANSAMTIPTTNDLPQLGNSLTNSQNLSFNRITATVYTRQVSQLSFQENGYVKSVAVKNGQFVKKGSVIARLDSDILNQELILAQNEKKQAASALGLAKATRDRIIELNKKQATTQANVEKATNDYYTARIAVKTAEAKVTIARLKQQNGILRAPFDGYVFNLDTWVGSYVSQSTEILTLVSLSDLQVQIPVPQTIANNFQVGQEFSFTSTTNQNSGTLTITGIVPFVDPNTKTYSLYAKPKKTNSPLMAGELILVKLH